MCMDSEKPRKSQFDFFKGRPPTTATLRSRGVTTASRARSTRTALHTASQVSRAATALAGGAPFTAGTPLSLRFQTKDDKYFVPAAKTLFEYVYYSEGDVRKVLYFSVDVRI